MIEAILSGGWSAVAGGLFGTVGSLAKGWLEARHEKQMAELRMQERDADRSHELAVMDREAEHAAHLASIEAAKEERVADLGALQTSLLQEAQGATWSAPWAARLGGFWAGLVGVGLGLVDIVRGLMRPLITTYLLGLTTALTVRVFGQMGGLDDAHAFDLLLKIVDMVLFLSCTSVGWWFGSRPAGGLLKPR
ncbi:MAG: hypothetical protein AB1578_12015 [Thermodesulfobacteriota bacterium]